MEALQELSEESLKELRKQDLRWLHVHDEHIFDNAFLAEAHPEALDQSSSAASGDKSSTSRPMAKSLSGLFRLEGLSTSAARSSHQSGEDLAAVSGLVDGGPGAESAQAADLAVQARTTVASGTSGFNAVLQQRLEILSRASVALSRQALWEQMAEQLASTFTLRVRISKAEAPLAIKLCTDVFLAVINAASTNSNASIARITADAALDPLIATLQSSPMLAFANQPVKVTLALRSWLQRLIHDTHFNTSSRLTSKALTALIGLAVASGSLNAILDALKVLLLPPAPLRRILSPYNIPPPVIGTPPSSASAGSRSSTVPAGSAMSPPPIPTTPATSPHPLTSAPGNNNVPSPSTPTSPPSSSDSSASGRRRRPALSIDTTPPSSGPPTPYATPGPAPPVTPHPTLPPPPAWPALSVSSFLSQMADWQTDLPLTSPVETAHAVAQWSASAVDEALPAGSGALMGLPPKLSLDEDSRFSAGVSMATDGRYLYLHTRRGLVKLGTGSGDTVQGSVAAMRPGWRSGESGSLAVVAGRLYYRSPGIAPACLLVVDTDTLADMPPIPTEAVPDLVAESPRPRSPLVSDGRYLYLLSYAGDRISDRVPCSAFHVDVFDPLDDLGLTHIRRVTITAPKDSPASLRREHLGAAGWFTNGRMLIGLVPPSTAAPMLYAADSAPSTPTRWAQIEVPLNTGLPRVIEAPSPPLGTAVAYDHVENIIWNAGLGSKVSTTLPTSALDDPPLAKLRISKTRNAALRPRHRFPPSYLDAQAPSPTSGHLPTPPGSPSTPAFPPTAEGVLTAAPSLFGLPTSGSLSHSLAPESDAPAQKTVREVALILLAHTDRLAREFTPVLGRSGEIPPEETDPIDVGKEPFALDLDPSTFEYLDELLSYYAQRYLLTPRPLKSTLAPPRASTATDAYTVLSCLRLLKANFHRLIQTRVDPAEMGLQANAESTPVAMPGSPMRSPPPSPAPNLPGRSSLGPDFPSDVPPSTRVVIGAPAVPIVNSPPSRSSSASTLSAGGPSSISSSSLGSGSAFTSRTRNRAHSIRSLRSGWLHLQAGGIPARWQRVWVVLYPSSLAVMESPGSRSVITTIPLKECEISYTRTNMSGPTPHGFKVVVVGRIHFFVAMDENDLELWMGAMTDAAASFEFPEEAPPPPILNHFRTLLFAFIQDLESHPVSTADPLIASECWETLTLGLDLLYPTAKEQAALLNAIIHQLHRNRVQTPTDSTSSSTSSSTHQSSNASSPSITLSPPLPARVRLPGSPPQSPVGLLTPTALSKLHGGLPRSASEAAPPSPMSTPRSSNGDLQPSEDSLTLLDAFANSSSPTKHVFVGRLLQRLSEYADISDLVLPRTSTAVTPSRKYSMLDVDPSHPVNAHPSGSSSSGPPGSSPLLERLLLVASADGSQALAELRDTNPKARSQPSPAVRALMVFQRDLLRRAVSAQDETALPFITMKSYAASAMTAATTLIHAVSAAAINANNHNAAALAEVVRTSLAGLPLRSLLTSLAVLPAHLAADAALDLVPKLQALCAALSTLSEHVPGLAEAEQSYLQGQAFRRDPPAEAMAESAHPYEPQVDKEETITIPGATSLELHFDPRCASEGSWDSLQIFERRPPPRNAASSAAAAAAAAAAVTAPPSEQVGSPLSGIRWPQTPVTVSGNTVRLVWRSTEPYAGGGTTSQSWGWRVTVKGVIPRQYEPPLPPILDTLKTASWLAGKLAGCLVMGPAVSLAEHELLPWLTSPVLSGGMDPHFQSSLGPLTKAPAFVPPEALDSLSSLALAKKVPPQVAGLTPNVSGGRPSVSSSSTSTQVRLDDVYKPRESHDVRSWIEHLVSAEPGTGGPRLVEALRSAAPRRFYGRALEVEPVHKAERAVMAVMLKHSGRLGLAMEWAEAAASGRPTRPPDPLVRLWKWAGKIREWLMQKHQEAMQAARSPAATATSPTSPSSDQVYDKLCDGLGTRTAFLLRLSPALKASQVAERPSSSLATYSAPAPGVPIPSVAAVRRLSVMRGAPMGPGNLASDPEEKSAGEWEESVASAIMAFMDAKVGVYALERYMRTRQWRAVSRMFGLFAFGSLMSAVSFASARQDALRWLGPALRGSKLASLGRWHYSDNTEGIDRATAKDLTTAFTKLHTALAAMLGSSQTDPVSKLFLLDPWALCFRTKADIEFLLSSGIFTVLGKTLKGVTQSGSSLADLSRAGPGHSTLVRSSTWTTFRLLAALTFVSGSSGSNESLATAVQRSIVEFAHAELRREAFLARRMEGMTGSSAGSSGASSLVDDSFMFDILGLLYSLSASSGALAVASQGTFMNLLMNLLQSGTPRVQRLILRCFRRLLPRASPDNVATDADEPSIVVTLLRLVGAGQYDSAPRPPSVTALEDQFRSAGISKPPSPVGGATSHEMNLEPEAMDPSAVVAVTTRVSRRAASHTARPGSTTPSSSGPILNAGLRSPFVDPPKPSSTGEVIAGGHVEPEDPLGGGGAVIGRWRSASVTSAVAQEAAMVLRVLHDSVDWKPEVTAALEESMSKLPRLLGVKPAPASRSSTSTPPLPGVGRSSIGGSSKAAGHPSALDLGGAEGSSANEEDLFIVTGALTVLGGTVEALRVGGRVEAVAKGGGVRQTGTLVEYDRLSVVARVVWDSAAGAVPSEVDVDKLRPLEEISPPSNGLRLTPVMMRAFALLVLAPASVPSVGNASAFITRSSALYPHLRARALKALSRILASPEATATFLASGLRTQLLPSLTAFASAEGKSKITAASHDYISSVKLEEQAVRLAEVCTEDGLWTLDVNQAGRGLAGARSSVTTSLSSLLPFFPYLELSLALPTRWATSVRDSNVAFADAEGGNGRGRLAKYVGRAKSTTDVSLIRANAVIPTAVPVYYFEVTVMAEGASGTEIGVGLIPPGQQLYGMPGWFNGSYGYHANGERYSYKMHGAGKDYGPTYGVGDTVGVCWDRRNSTIFFTKNGSRLSTAFKRVSGVFYPCAGLHSPDAELRVNFGHSPFMFDLEAFVEGKPPGSNTRRRPRSTAASDTALQDTAAAVANVAARAEVGQVPTVSSPTPSSLSTSSLAAALDALETRITAATGHDSEEGEPWTLEELEIEDGVDAALQRSSPSGMTNEELMFALADSTVTERRKSMIERRSSVNTPVPPGGGPTGSPALPVVSESVEVPDEVPPSLSMASGGHGDVVDGPQTATTTTTANSSVFMREAELARTAEILGVPSAKLRIGSGEYDAALATRAALAGIIAEEVGFPEAICFRALDEADGSIAGALRWIQDHGDEFSLEEEEEEEEASQGSAPPSREADRASRMPGGSLDNTLDSTMDDDDFLDETLEVDLTPAPMPAPTHGVLDPLDDHDRALLEALSTGRPPPAPPVSTATALPRTALEDMDVALVEAAARRLVNAVGDETTASPSPVETASPVPPLEARMEPEQNENDPPEDPAATAGLEAEDEDDEDEDDVNPASGDALWGGRRPRKRIGVDPLRLSDMHVGMVVGIREAVVEEGSVGLVHNSGRGLPVLGRVRAVSQDGVEGGAALLEVYDAELATLQLIWFAVSELERPERVVPPDPLGPTGEMRSPGHEHGLIKLARDTENALVVRYARQALFSLLSAWPENTVGRLSLNALGGAQGFVQVLKLAATEWIASPVASAELDGEVHLWQDETVPLLGSELKALLAKLRTLFVKTADMPVRLSPVDPRVVVSLAQMIVEEALRLMRGRTHVDVACWMVDFVMDAGSEIRSPLFSVELFDVLSAHLKRSDGSSFVRAARLLTRLLTVMNKAGVLDDPHRRQPALKKLDRISTIMERRYGYESTKKPLLTPYLSSMVELMSTVNRIRMKQELDADRRADGRAAGADADEFLDMDFGQSSEEQSWFTSVLEVGELFDVLAQNKAPSHVVMAKALLEHTMKVTVTRESRHPYPGSREKGSVSIPGAKYMMLVFDEKCQTEENDFLKLSTSDDGGTDLGMFGGKFGGYKFAFYGDHFWFQFTAGSGGNVHDGFGCDGCGMFPIRGLHFKCANCPNYDLCEACEASETAHNRSHAMWRIVRPLAASHAVFPALPVGPVQEEADVHRTLTCSRCETGGIRGTAFICGNCPEYVLCEACEDAVAGGEAAIEGHSQTHVFLQVRVPRDNGIAGVLGEGWAPLADMYPDDLRWGYRFSVMGELKDDEKFAVVTKNREYVEAAAVAAASWSLEDDGELMKAVAAVARWKDVNPLVLTVDDFEEFKAAHEEQWASDFPRLARVGMAALHVRNSLLRMLNVRFPTAFVQAVDMSMVDKNWSLAGKLARLRGLIWPNVKAELLDSVLNATGVNGAAGGPGVRRPPTLKLSRARKRGGDGDDKALEVDSGKSWFEQGWKRLGRLPASRLRDREQAWIVQFAGEGAQDVGGPYRESIAEMCAELQGGAVSLLIPVPNGQAGLGSNRERFMPNPAATSPRQLSMFEWLGKMMGVALRTKQVLALDLASLVWKPLVGMEVTRSDVGAIDSGTFQSLEAILRLEEQGVTEEMFSDVITEVWTVRTADGRDVELVTGGEERPVTWADRAEYVSAAMDYRVQETARQVAAIGRGLAAVVPSRVLMMFTPQELERRVCGAVEVDVRTLREHTSYRGLSPAEPVVGFFWKVLEKMSTDERRLFLRFVWGRSRLPGPGAVWPQRFELQALERSGEGDADERLPVSHTCFFSLSVPRYSSVEVMEAKLKYAIKHCRAIDADFNPRALDEEDDEEDE